MKTNDQILTIKAAILYILQSFPHGMDNVKLYKLMYFAQQEHLCRFGRVIFDETFKALRLGPVPSFTQKAFEYQIRLHDNHAHKHDETSEEITESMKQFCQSFQVNKVTNEKDKLVTRISSSDQPDLDELSKSDIECLDKIINEYKDTSAYDLARLSHKDQAWLDTREKMKEDPEMYRITSIEILKSANASPEMIDYVKENMQIIDALS